jgi:cephalosporin-C deacetylase-like acetyl esterase
MVRPSLVALVLPGLCIHLAAARPAAADAATEYLEFIRSQAAALRAADAPPATRDAWRRQRESLRAALAGALGGFPADPCPLEPRILGTLPRDGYRVEKLVFQTRPGVFMTANAYVPAGEGKHPAILQVHGHWRGAKQDPVVQARCIGAAKLGFFVLVVDAFGAGERAGGKALGEYHGAMTGATLLPIGLPLSGIQVYENLRAVDYLRTRPEVDARKIGITGASGGGNQTMYAGALDERLAAVVPVCSVGNYQAYLGTGCCLCELVPGALRFTEEWGVLGLVAPRALLVINATQDAHQFSVGEASKSIAGVEPVFRLLGREDQVRHAIFESKHDYNRPMREAMYGWMARALEAEGEGDGAPVPEPELKTEDPETLRCYPGDSRPDDWVTIPRFAAELGRALLAERRMPRDSAEWQTTNAARGQALLEKVFGGFPSVPPVTARVEPDDDGPARLVHFQPEPGLHLTARVEPGATPAAPLAVLLNLEGAGKAATGSLAGAVRDAGWTLVTLDLRATGALAATSYQAARVPDHNSAEWGIWIGRPLLGQWAFDVRRLLDALQSTTLRSQCVVLGEGPAGLVALAAAAVDQRITKVAAVGTLASYLTDVPYEGQRLGIMAPGIVREVGDVCDLAVLAAPRRVVIAGAVAGNGTALSLDQLHQAYHGVEPAWERRGAPPGLLLRESSDAAGVLEALR